MAPASKERKREPRIIAVDLPDERRARLRKDKNHHYLLEIGPRRRSGLLGIKRVDRNISIFNDEMDPITLLFSRRFICR